MQEHLFPPAEPAVVVRQAVVTGRRLSYRVKRSDRARRWRLEFSARDGLVVVLPRRFDDAGLDAILAVKERWIRRRLEEYAVRKRLRDKRRLRDGGPFLYLGREYTLRRVPGPGRRGAVAVADRQITVNVPPPDGAALAAAVGKWLRRRARAIITPLAAAESARLGVRYGRIFIRDQRTRWASCSSAGNLNFNFRVAMAPPAVIRYLVGHELVHVKVLRHNKRFWNLLARYYPAYAAEERWLRENEDLLFIEPEGLKS